MKAIPTEFGPISGLICGENSNPLAAFAFIAQGTRFHVSSWPNHFPTSGDPMRIRVAIDSQAFAQMSKAFVISPCGTVDEDMIAKLQVGPEGEAFLRNPDCCGGSVIVGPTSASSPGRWELRRASSTPTATWNCAIATKLRHDFAGHYNRPDIFQLYVNERRPRLYNTYGDDGPCSPPADSTGEAAGPAHQEPCPGGTA